MRDILSPSGRDARARVAGSRSLLAFDYDGTLVPISRDPERAVMRRTTRRWLTRAASLYPTAIVSGRSLPELRRLLRGIPLCAIIGNHGAEESLRSPELRATAARMRSWKRRLALELAGREGVGIEDKRLSLSIHWRAAPDRREARAAARAAADRLVGARLVAGKCVLNVTDERAPHKGIAVEALRTRLDCEVVAFVGDDVTDEDAFSLASAGSAVAIRVGRSRRSLAPWYLTRQSEIDRLLAVLVRAREGSREARTDPRGARTATVVGKPGSRPRR